MSSEKERLLKMQERLRELADEDMQCLAVAGLVGLAELAVELERLGLSDEEHSLKDADWAQQCILVAVEVVRRERLREA